MVEERNQSHPPEQQQQHQHPHHVTHPHKGLIDSTSTSPVNGPSLVKIATNNGNHNHSNYPYNYTYIYNAPPPSASSGMSNLNHNPYSSIHHSNSTISSTTSPAMSSDAFSNRSTSSFSSGGGGGGGAASTSVGVNHGHSRSHSRSHSGNSNPVGISHHAGGQSSNGRRAGGLSTRTSFSSLDIGENSAQDRESSPSDREPLSSSSSSSYPKRSSWKSTSRTGSASGTSSNGVQFGYASWNGTPDVDEERDEFIQIDSSFDSASSTSYHDSDHLQEIASSGSSQNRRDQPSPSRSEAREMNDETPTPGQRHPTESSDDNYPSFQTPKRREGSDASTFIDSDRNASGSTSKFSSRNPSISQVAPSSHQQEYSTHSRNTSHHDVRSQTSVNSNSSKSLSFSIDSSISSSKLQASAASNHSSSSSSSKSKPRQFTSTWADPPLSAPASSSGQSSFSRPALTAGEREMLSALNAQLEKCPSREDLPNDFSSNITSFGSRGRKGGFWDGGLGGSEAQPFEYKDGYGFTRVDNSQSYASTSGDRSRSNSFGATLGLRRRSSEVALGAARKAIDATKRSMGMLRKRESGTWESVDPETGLRTRLSRRSSRSSSFSTTDQDLRLLVIDPSREKESLEEEGIQFDHLPPSPKVLSRNSSFSRLSNLSSKASRLSKRATSVDLGLDLRNSASSFKISRPDVLKKRSSKEIVSPSSNSHARSMSSSQVHLVNLNARREASHSRSNSSLNLSNLKISAPIGPVTSAIPGSPSPSTASMSQSNPLSSSQGPPSSTPRKFSFAQGQGMLSQVWETDAERERMSPSGSGEIEEGFMRSISQQSIRPEEASQSSQQPSQLGEESTPGSVLLDGQPFPPSPLPMTLRREGSIPDLKLLTSTSMSRNASNAESSADSLASSVSDISPIHSIAPPLPEASSNLFGSKPEEIFSPVLTSKPKISAAFDSSESPRSGPVLLGSERTRNREGSASVSLNKEDGSRRPSDHSSKSSHSQVLDPQKPKNRIETSGKDDETSASSNALEKRSGSSSSLAHEARKGSEGGSSHAKAQAQSLAQTYAKTHSRLPSSTGSSTPKSSLAKKSYNALLNLLAQGSTPSISSSPISNPIPSAPNFHNPNLHSNPKAIESSAPTDSGSSGANGSGFNGTVGGGWDASSSTFQSGANGIASFGGGGIGSGSGSGSGNGGNGNPNGNQPTSTPSHPSAAAVQNIFRRLELVGRGAYGAVYRGVHVASGTAVALKVVNLDTPEDDVSDIQREVAVLSQLREADQKNVVRYWGCWLTGHELWIVMDFAEGGSIRTLVS